ncbi:MAG: hypothetical protein AAGI69_16650 [Cyanobacteria bacterium P01_H01_bin.21]
MFWFIVILQFELFALKPLPEGIEFGGINEVKHKVFWDALPKFDEFFGLHLTLDLIIFRCSLAPTQS